MTVWLSKSWRLLDTISRWLSEKNLGGVEEESSGKAFRCVLIVTPSITNKHSLFNGGPLGPPLIESVMCNDSVSRCTGGCGGGRRGGGLGG